MVSTSAIIAVCVTLFVTLFLPIIVYIIYGMKNKGKGVWTAWLLGAAGFFVMQVIIRLPIVNMFSYIERNMMIVGRIDLGYCLILAFTAGLAEVIGRYVVAKILSKNLTFTKGIATGLGHGGIEAMVLVGMTYINNLLYMIMINTGIYNTLVEEALNVEEELKQLIALRNIIIGTSAEVFYLAGYERILTMIFHTALSLLVCYFVWKKKDIVGILICLVTHTLVDFITAVISSLPTQFRGKVIVGKMSYVLIYTFLTLIAAGSVVVIWRIKKLWKEDAE